MKTAQTFGKMRANGTLEYRIAIEDGLNEYGEPIDSTIVWSNPIKCSISVIRDTSNGKYEDGKFRQSSYNVLIEGVKEVNFSTIRLTRRGENLGEFEVLSVEPLTSVGRTRIVV